MRTVSLNQLNQEGRELLESVVSPITSLNSFDIKFNQENVNLSRTISKDEFISRFLGRTH